MSPFASLSPPEFELVVADLLRCELGVRFETFAAGRDGGIDLRSTTPELHIVQCKHYVHSDARKLVGAAKHELGLLKKMRPRPDRYTFVTSRRLTPALKRELVTILKGFVRGPEDILGGEDLEGLLSAHPQVERSHVKLWLASPAAMERVVRSVVQSGVQRRSRSLMVELGEMVSRWVPTQSFDVAAQMLADHNVVLIAGAPGVGKTTLARLLQLKSAQEGFEPISIKADVEAAENLLDDERRQLFFFDDFLGRVALHDGDRTDVRDLARLIGDVRRSERTRLILATRENVLQKARQSIEDLQWTRLEVDKYALTLDAYTRSDRAKIFYNHIYFSEGVGTAARRSLLADEGYLQVIDHENYNPRLIQIMTGLAVYEPTAGDEADYTAFCLATLDVPDILWRRMYEAALTPEARRLVLLLPTLPPEVPAADLEQAFLRSEAVDSVGRRRFDEALKLLEGSFVRTYEYDVGPGTSVEIFIGPLNPGVIDFARRRLIEDPQLLLDAMRVTQDFAQARILFMLWHDEGRPLGEQFFEVACTTLNRTLLDHLPATIDSHDGLATAMVERAMLLTTLLHEAPELRDRLTNAEALDRSLAEIAHWMSRAKVSTVISLVLALRDAGLPYHALGTALTQAEIANLQYEPDYEILVELKSALPGLVSDHEWLEVLHRFESDARELLSSPEVTEHVLDYLEPLGEGLGVSLDPLGIDDARRTIATRAVDPEDDVDRAWPSYRVEPSSADSDAAIRELFASLSPDDADDDISSEPG
jgi:hypothetical protein